MAQGITGRLTMCDGKTGVPRAVIDIEKAAKLRTVEESVKGLRFKPYREMGSGEGYSLEDGVEVGSSVEIGDTIKRTA